MQINYIFPNHESGCEAVKVDPTNVIWRHFKDVFFMICGEFSDSWHGGTQNNDNHESGAGRKISSICSPSR